MQWLRGATPYALFAGLALLLMAPALNAPPMSHDSFWIDRNWSVQFTAELARGNPYPRWLPWSFGGLGSPVFYFYAPLSFYLAGLFGLLGLATYPALMAAFGAAWFASGAAMHAWLRREGHAPILGAILYMVLPYHVMDFYARGALAEFCAFAVVPLVAIGVREATDRGRTTPLALGYAALIMTHLPTAVIVSVLLIAPMSLWAARRDVRRLWPVARGVAGGLAGAAIYLLPALTLQRYSSMDALWSNRFMQPASWSLLHPELWISTSYVLLFAGLAGATALAAVIVGWRRWDFWSVWLIGVCAIIVGLVPGFWSLPVLKAVQFPWRALLVAQFGLATIVARHRGSSVKAVAAVAPLLGLAVLMADPANPMHGDPIQPLPVPGMQDVSEYLPAGAVDPLGHLYGNRIERAMAAAHTSPGSVFSFPSVQAQCGDGALRPLLRNPDSRLIATPPAGCRASIERLPVERLGALISLTTWLGMAAAGLWPLLRRRARRSRPALAKAPISC